eukprot:1859980-Rhodomonas_salina.2
MNFEAQADQGGGWLRRLQVQVASGPVAALRCDPASAATGLALSRGRGRAGCASRGLRPKSHNVT